MKKIRIDGVITDNSSADFYREWLGISATSPKDVEESLQGDGDVEVWINSDGGLTTAGSEIYTLLRDYKGRKVVKISGIAASIASVIAMAGDEVLISPTAQFMLHNCLVFINSYKKREELSKTVEMMKVADESIINAYELKTGLSREKIAELMENETYLEASKSVELGFADGILFNDDLPLVAGNFTLDEKMTAHLKRKLEVKNMTEEEKALLNSLIEKSTENNTVDSIEEETEPVESEVTEDKTEGIQIDEIQEKIENALKENETLKEENERLVALLDEKENSINEYKGAFKKLSISVNVPKNEKKESSKTVDLNKLDLGMKLPSKEDVLNGYNG